MGDSFSETSMSFKTETVLTSNKAIKVIANDSNDPFLRCFFGHFFARNLQKHLNLDCLGPGFCGAVELFESEKTTGLLQQNHCYGPWLRICLAPSRRSCELGVGEVMLYIFLLSISELLSFFGPSQGCFYLSFFESNYYAIYFFGFAVVAFVSFGASAFASFLFLLLLAFAYFIILIFLIIHHPHPILTDSINNDEDNDNNNKNNDNDNTTTN